jgi:anti-sigma B factor antagonist
MQIDERAVGDVTILDLKGRLVAGDGDDLFRGTVDRLVNHGRRKLLLNLEGVPDIDSCGLGVLVSKYVTLRRGNGQLKLCNIRPRPRRVLDITKLLTVIEAFDSEADGVESFADAPEV